MPVLVVGDHTRLLRGPRPRGGHCDVQGDAWSIFSIREKRAGDTVPISAPPTAFGNIVRGISSLHEAVQLHQNGGSRELEPPGIIDIAGELLTLARRFVCSG
jgi:hypothetical protein